MNPETLAIARENLISLGIRPTVDDILQEARRMETMGSQTRPQGRLPRSCPS